MDGSVEGKELMPESSRVFSPTARGSNEVVNKTRLTRAPAEKLGKHSRVALATEKRPG